MDEAIETESAAGSAAKSAPRTRTARWGVRLLSVVAGLLVGLVIAEAAFYLRDDGAFPHINVFVPDETLAMRLEPGATTRISFHGNPVTDVRINAAGFRGPELPAPSDDEILVVGDSQVFGLGVEEDEAFATRLASLTDRPVVNAGVPTYGPLEYTEVVRRVLAERQPRTVVVVYNMSNDFFEHSRPNTARHAEWDGWAVRSETRPTDVAEFPGRRWLFGRSHLFYAARRWLHGGNTSLDAVRVTGFASEGTIEDLVAGGEHVAQLEQAAEQAHREEVAAHRARMLALAEDLDATENEIDRAVWEASPEQLTRDDNDLLYEAGRNHPGDIISEDFGEEARSIVVTARLLDRAVRMRERVQNRIAAETPAVARLLERRTELQAQRETQRASVVTFRRAPSVLAPRIEELFQLTAENGAELMVVALPLDVVVSPEEFRKYGQEPVDVSASQALLTDLVEEAHRHGARAVDLTPALREAEPGAFLDGDLHLSPRGHEAVAVALAATLAEPPPLARPEPGLPEGRSPIPTPDDFLRVAEATVRGSSRAGCATHLIHEWLRISCRSTGRHRPTGVSVVEGGHDEVLTVQTEAANTLIAPVFAGERFVADFRWQDRTQRLVVDWAEGEDAPDMHFEDAVESDSPPVAVSEEAAALCACHIEVHALDRCTPERFPGGYIEHTCEPSCQELYGAPSAGCVARYADDCASLLRCVRGDLATPPACPDGEVAALGTQRCLPSCDPDSAPCEEGRCVPWRGAHVCVP